MLKNKTLVNFSEQEDFRARFIHGPVPGWKTQHCFRSRAARDVDCCKNNCVPYSIFLLSSIHKGSGRETLAEPPVMDGSVWHWCPRRVLQEQLRTLLIFSPSIQERAAGRRWRGPTVHGSGMAPGSQTVARTFAYLIQFFFRWIARPSSQQPGGTQCECCYHVRYGPTAVEGWLLTAIGPGPFRPRVWQVNPSRYRFDVAMFSSLEELSCKLREARTSSIG